MSIRSLVAARTLATDYTLSLNKDAIEHGEKSNSWQH